MKVTLLGTGDPLGMPVPLCDCQYCEEGPERLRTGLIVEEGNTSLVFDIGPDIREQLIKSQKNSIDGFFVTHSHIDHIGGIFELNNLHQFTEEEITLYGSSSVENYLEENFDWIDINFEKLENESTEVRDLEVTSFSVEHSDVFPEQGFTIQKNSKKIVYIPDIKSLPDREIYNEADLLFIDGMYFFRKHIEDDQDHAAEEELRQEIEKAEAEKVVLLNISEHFNEMTLEEEKTNTEYVIPEDFESFEV